MSDRPAASQGWAAIRRVLDAALELPAGERATFVERACGGDAALRGEVERLLASCDRAAGDGFLAGSATEYVAPVLRDLALRDALAAAQPPAELARALAERYTLDREIGRGAMATVLLARDLRFDRRVAIKVLRQELARECDVRHFQREIGWTARLNHPHIVQVLDAGDAGGLLYYVMPYMEGGTLRQRLTRERRLARPETIAVARTIAQALDCAHRHGLVHRDVKPENILFAEGQPSLADFGIARALDRVSSETWSSVGIIRGTAEYMSPEQIRAAERLDARTDVYALACVLYEMLAGSPPFTGGTPLAIMRRHLHDEPPPLRGVRPPVPGALQRAIARALAKDPARRPDSAAAFAEDLAAGA